MKEKFFCIIMIHSNEFILLIKFIFFKFINLMDQFLLILNQTIDDDSIIAM